MTRTHTQRNLIAASAFGVVSAFMMFAQAGQASAATSVSTCEGPSRRAVLQCCETNVKKSGLPIWMRQAGASCHTPAIVKCSNNRCKIAVKQGDELRGDNDKGGRGRGKR